MENSKFKKIIIFVLIVAIFIMSSAYATLYQQLRINGHASVVASWKVEIVGIKEANKVGTAVSLSIPTYTINTASFNAQLQNSTDSIDYVVSVKNSGKIDAKLNSIIKTQGGSDAVVYEIINASENDVLKAGETVDITIRIKMDSNATVNDVVNSDIIMIFNDIQNI